MSGVTRSETSWTWSFNILLKSSCITVGEDGEISGAFNILLKSSVYVYSSNMATLFAFQYSFEIICWVGFCLWFLKFFLFVSWFSWGHVSASNAYGSCLFPRFVLEIEFLFPRNFNSHGNDLFPR